MNPITHLLASWSLLEASGLPVRDRAIVVWVGVAPDLDGLGVIPDTLAPLFGQADPAFFGRYHHFLLHGLLAAVLLPAIGIAFARRRFSTFLWGVAAVHLHLACDFVGSHGPTADEIWPIHYLAPFSQGLTWSWSGQWALNAWPNFAFTVGLIAFGFVRAAAVGHSPVSLISVRAHDVFVAAVQARWSQLRGRV